MKLSVLRKALVGTGLVLFVSCATLAQPTAPAGAVLAGDDALRAQYTLPNSRFMNIDGTPVHYVDEGSGPAILLLHGSYSSLRQWNVWAAELKKKYRVIRFDMPPAGLSGPSAHGNYTTEDNFQLIDTLTQRLGVNRFMVISTSTGAITGVAYASLHPNKVIAQVFGNAVVGPFKYDPSKLSEDLKKALAEAATHPGYHKPEFWRQILLANMEDKTKVTPELAQEWTDLNNRALRMPTKATKPSLTRTAEDLKSIRVPTLVLWGAEDHEMGLEHAEAAMALLPGPDKQLIVMPGCGHMMPPDCAGDALAKAMPFIDRVLQAAN
ncbi:hypothetical protein CHU95_20930 [Niveispirillum lacus]|uniref:AB hydrolase-1 domain-containing protein n=1 Tax=Niveispirillum lacus TaxID=1981099 RepID=A0A255YQU9_9PROT|nr:alpha/beta hydrolase [Niveispirillum lacus]OYQ31606.1 hypothetical protein CHU95_20930 [Niveispirillum lacus]